jgi:hypothetical protein
VEGAFLLESIMQSFIENHAKKRFLIYDLENVVISSVGKERYQVEGGYIRFCGFVEALMSRLHIRPVGKEKNG